MKENRLYRVVNGKVIGGVAGGLAEYFGMDPTIIRIIFILLTLMGGGGVLIYLILWIVVPEKYNVYPPYTAPYTRPDSFTSSGSGIGETYEGYMEGTIPPPVVDTKGSGKKFDGSLIAGLVMILIGSFFLFERFIPNIDFEDFWPLLLVLIGVIMIFRGFPVMKKAEDPDSITDKNSNIKETVDNDNQTNNDINL